MACGQIQIACTRQDLGQPRQTNCLTLHALLFLSQNQGLAHFWMLGLPALLPVALVLRSGLHRLEGHVEEEKGKEAGVLPFLPVVGAAVCISLGYCLIVRLVTIFLVRSFPGQDAQGWGGTTVFAGGISVVLGAFVWGHFSDRFGRGRIIAVTQCLCAPFMYQLLHVKEVWLAPFWMSGVGFTMGAAFPLTVVLAREARGLTQRLRIGLVIGGAWGLGEIAFILGGKHVGRYPAGTVAPVSGVLNLCWFFLIGAAAMGVMISRMEGASDASDPLSVPRGLP